MKAKGQLHLRVPHYLLTSTVSCLILLGHPTHGQTPLPAALPRLQYVGVILSADDLNYAPHKDIIYPTVVKMSDVPNALGKYYLYYAPHDVPGGICLAYADKLKGPWKEYATNPVIQRAWGAHHSVSHVSGPDAIWDEEEKEIFLYYHGENDVTRLAESRDGVNFEYGGEVINTKMFEKTSEASYGRVFRHTLPGKNNKYVMLLMGNQSGTRRIFLAWSNDGRKWEAQPKPIMDPPPGTDQVAGAVYLNRGGQHYLIFHANNSKLAFNEGYNLYVAETDPAFSKVRHLGKFMERTFVSPDNPGVMSPFFLEDEGKLAVFFNVGPRLRNKIALATEIGLETAQTGNP
jgi:hypothetical protein